jgi:hypothetical protein
MASSVRLQPRRKEKRRGARRWFLGGARDLILSATLTPSTAVGGAEGERCTGCPDAIATATSASLQAVQRVQLSLQGGNARRSLVQWQWVIGHAPDLAQA